MYSDISVFKYKIFTVGFLYISRIYWIEHRPLLSYNE